MPFSFEAPDTGSDEELLALVRNAIAVVLGGGQEYEIRGRVFKRADLATLYQMERNLQSRVRRRGGLAKNLARLKRKNTDSPPPVA